MNVLIIPEDFRKDQFILAPLITAMLSKIGKPRAKVIICRDPLLGGVSEALKWENIEEILIRYKGMVDLFLLCVDRDGIITRKESLERIEEYSNNLLASSDKILLAENAWQELEVWVLAGHVIPNIWKWKTIRNEIHPKELYFEPFAKRRNLSNEPGEGRKTLAEEAARQYPKIRRRCQEDIVNLENRIIAWMNSIS